MSHKLLFILVPVLILFFGCTKKEKPVATTRFQVKRGPLVGKLNWRGIVRSANRIEIRAQNALKISKFNVKNFDTVKKGQVILEVDRTEVAASENELKEKLKSLDLDMNSSKVKLSFSSKSLERKRTLFSKGIISQREFEDAKREYNLSQNETKAKQLDMDKAKKDLTELDAKLKTSNFVAPMDGVVSGLVSSETTLNPEVQAGQLLATVSNPNTLALIIRVEESNIPRLNIGMAAKVLLDAVYDEAFTGKILDISTSATQPDMNGGSMSPMKTYEVSVGFTGPKREVKEGYTGAVNIVYAEKNDALSIPLVALRYLDGKDLVLSAPDSTSSSKPTGVQVGLKTENEAEVLTGLTENDYVVVDAN